LQSTGQKQLTGALLTGDLWSILKQCFLLVCCVWGVGARAIFNFFRIGAIGALAFLVLVPDVTLAAAWTQKKGEGLIITSFTYDGAIKSFNAAGGLVSSPKFVKLEANIYAEYGLLDWLTVILTPGYQHVATGFSGIRRSDGGMNNTGIGGRIRLFRKRQHVVSLEATYFLPGGISTNETTVLSRGNGDVEVRALYGSSRVFSLFSHSFPTFVDLQLGYRQRDGAPANEYRADFTFGVRPFQKVQILVQSFNIISDGAGKPSDQVLFPAFQLHKAQLSGVYDISRRFSIQLGGFHTLAGRNIVQETALFGALWIRY